MSTVYVYSFADATGLTQYVDSSGDFVSSGTWASDGTYAAEPLNAVTYGAAQYMCIRDNIGDNPQRVPTRARPQSWSIMSLLYEYLPEPPTADSAYELAGSAFELAGSAYELANSGSNVAWAAWELAQIGTEIPPLSTLPDVYIPAPSDNQVLVFADGTWIAGDSPSHISAAAFTYFTDQVASGTENYLDAIPTPSGQAELATELAVGGGFGPFVASRSFITGQLNRSILEGGNWQFNSFGKCNVGSRTFVAVTDVFLRHIDGSETYLFSGTSTPFNSTSIQQQTGFTSQSVQACIPTDKLVFKYYVMRDSGPSTVATFYTAGSIHDSHIVTPLGYAHNDLFGLQGGAVDQFYHTTYDQNQALLGVSTPSADNPYATAADLTAAAAAVPNFSNGNRLISGGNAVWLSGYTFRVEPTTVDFNGMLVSFPQTDITLAASDPTDDRLDLIIADKTSETTGSVTGTPSTPPAFPDYDPVNQFELTFVPVDASTTEPFGVTRTWIYQENVEWVWDGSATVNPNSTSNPYEGTKDIEGTSVVNNQFFRMTAPETFESDAYETLYFYIAPKAGWGTRYLRLNWEASNSQRKGNYVALTNGAFGFDTENTGYQLVAIPMNLFGVASGTPIQKLRFQTISTTGSMGYYIDNIALQIGVPQTSQTIPDATTSTKGIVMLAVDGGTTAATVVQASDSRLRLTHQTRPYATTVTLDFNGSTFQTVVLTGNVQFEAVNMAEIKAITARVVASGGPWNLTFPGAWVFVTDEPTAIAASKTGILSLTSFGNAYADIVAAYVVQP